MAGGFALQTNLIVNDKYRIIRGIYRDDFSSIYVVNEVNSQKNLTLKEILNPVTDIISQSISKELKKVTEKYVKIDKSPDSPRMLDFFFYEGKSYLVLDYKDDETVERLLLYPSLGKTLKDRYIVVRGIASGGFGSVYLVRDLSLPGKYWAAKEMHEESDQEVIEKSFKIEAEMLAKLEHNCIPRVTDSFVESKKLYLIMDYIKGETLAKYLKKLPEGGYFSEEQIVTWAVQICDVLHYLHNRPTPIVFRDLKPDNIMITDEGVLKLIDFGIARVFQDTKTVTTKYALLTEGYAPPEQWMGKAEPRSDIYALGATLMCLITKINPQELAPEFPPPKTLNPKISDKLSNIVLKALQPRISDRYETIREMKQELLQLQKSKESSESEFKHLEDADRYREEGEYLKASFEYMKVLDFNCDNERALMGIGECYELLGLKDKAQEHYLNILNRNTEPELRDNVQNKLAACGIKTRAVAIEDNGFEENNSSSPRYNTIATSTGKNYDMVEKTKKTVIGTIYSPVAPAPVKEIKKQSHPLIKIFVAVALLFVIVSAGVVFLMKKSESPEKVYAKTLASVEEKKDLAIASSNMDKLLDKFNEKKVSLTEEDSNKLVKAWIEWAELAVKEKNPALKDVKKIEEQLKKLNRPEKKKFLKIYSSLLDNLLKKEDSDFKEEEEVLAIIEDFPPGDFEGKRGEKLGRYHRILGQNYLKSNSPDTVKGVDHLKTSDTLDNDNRDTRLALASYYMEHEDYENVIKYAETYAKNDTDISIMVADAYCFKKKDKNIKKNMSEALTRYNFTWENIKSYKSKGDKSKDDKIEKYRQRLVEGYNAIGSYYLDRKKNEDAIKIFSKARTIDEKNEASRKGLVRAYVAIGLKFYRQGFDYYDKAADNFKSAKKLDPSNTTATDYLNKIAKEKKEAEQYVPPVQNSYPDNYRYQYEPTQPEPGGNDLKTW